jgi:PHP family Zn ribbon phosphoesterase
MEAGITKHVGIEGIAKLRMGKYQTMQQCPHCHTELDTQQLYALDEELPSECKQCGELIRNTRPREIASWIAPLVVTGIIILGNFPPAFWLVPLILFPFVRIFLAKPVKAKYKEHPCVRCKRLDVGFRRSYHDICDECLTKEEHAKERGIR